MKQTKGKTGGYLINDGVKITPRDYRAACEYLEIAERDIAVYRASGLTPERCAELAQADKEGRLVCLAVKSNNTVYANENGETREVFISEVIESYTAAEGIEYQGFYADGCEDFSFKPSDVGKTVFLTAEAALRTAQEREMPLTVCEYGCSICLAHNHMKCPRIKEADHD